MSYQQEYEFDYMGDEGEMGNFLDEVDEDNNDRVARSDEYEMVCFYRVFPIPVMLGTLIFIEL